jgi:hypothetical protein
LGLDGQRLCATPRQVFAKNTAADTATIDVLRNTLKKVPEDEGPRIG